MRTLLKRRESKRLPELSFGWGFIDWPKDNKICTLHARLFCFGKGMRRHSNQPVSTKHPARVCDSKTIRAKMHPVRIHSQCNIDTIVHKKRGLVLMSQRSDPLCKIQERSGREILFSELDSRHSSRQSLIEDFKQRSSPGLPTIGHEVQPPRDRMHALRRA
jgi:hypothetical protein